MLGNIVSRSSLMNIGINKGECVFLVVTMCHITQKKERIGHQQIDITTLSTISWPLQWDSSCFSVSYFLGDPTFPSAILYAFLAISLISLSASQRPWQSSLLHQARTSAPLEPWNLRRCWAECPLERLTCVDIYCRCVYWISSLELYPML